MDQASCVLGMGEGIADKKLEIDGEETEFYCLKPYLIIRYKEGKMGVLDDLEEEIELEYDKIGELFKFKI